MLDRLGRASERLIVVLMPAHSWTRDNLDRVPRNPMLEVLAEYGSRGVEVLDLWERFPDSGLRDPAHPLPASRAILSREVAEFVKGR